MPEPLSLGTPHHIRLTVTDVERSRAFYTGILGFEVAVDEAPPEGEDFHEEITETLQGGVVLTNAGVLIGLRPVDAAHAGDRFDPFRVGLDHLSFNLETRAALEAAAGLLDEHGVEHGPVRDLAPLGLCFLAFFDPDGMALELTAPVE